MYISARSIETQRMERLKTIVYPGERPPSVIKSSPIARYPVGLFLLSASGTTFGIWGGVHLLWQSKTAKKNPKKKKS
jgi:hypothetical protein